MLSFICWQRASKWSTAVMPSTKENYNRWRLHRSCEKKTLLQVFDVLKVLKHYLSHLFSLSFSDFLNIQKMCFAYIICMFLLICLFIYKLDASSSQSRHLEGVRDVPRHSANLPMLHHIFRIFANASVEISNAFQLKMCSFFNKQMKCLVISWSISLWNAQESMSWWYVVRSQRISMVLPSHLLSNLTMSLAHE